MKAVLEVVELQQKSSFKVSRCDSGALLRDWHFHDKFELSYLPESAGRLKVGDHTAPPRPGSVFLIAPHLPHRWEPDAAPGNSSTPYLVYFSKSLIDSARTLFPELDVLGRMLDDAKLGIAFSPCKEINEIGASLARLEHLQGCEKIREFLDILGTLRSCQYETLASREHMTTCGAEAGGKSDVALEYIRRNYTQAIDLEFISRVSCMSPGYFCRSFKAAYGVGFLTYINDLRVERMCRLLETTNAPVSKIALEIGFNSISNCNRSFKKRKGVSPCDYRRRCQRNR